MRRSLTVFLLGLLLTTGSALLDAPGALAVHVKHAFQFSFDTSEIHPPLSPEPTLLGIAVDSSGGPSDSDVYVGELLQGEDYRSRIYKFDEKGHYQGVTIDGSETPAGSLFLLGEQALWADNAIAVDSGAGAHSGDVYVADAAHGVVDLFDENGHYLCQITGKANPSGSECNGAAGSQVPDSAFEPVGVAVDPSNGHLYVANFAGDAVDEFSAAGAYLGEVTDPSLKGPFEIALDSTGALYAMSLNVSPQKVLKFGPSGSLQYTVAENPIGLAVDQATDEVYVSTAHAGQQAIDVYDSAGNLEEGFLLSSGEETYPSLAINPDTGMLYAAYFLIFDHPPVVEVFGPDAILPLVTTNPASGVEETAATLLGEAVPDPDEVVSCFFEYGPTSDYGQTAPCSPAPPFTAASPVSANLTGLAASTTYHFRLVAKTAPPPPRTRAIPAYGVDRTFSTVGHPTVEEESTDGLARTAATLHAQINPHAFASEGRFEYVDAAHFESEGGFASPATKSTPLIPLGDGIAPVPLSASLTGLEVGTTYHFRAVASNERGGIAGPGSTFTTRPVAAVEHQWAYAHVTDARVEAEIVPGGLSTICRVQYVDDTQFQASGYGNPTSVPCEAGLGSGSTASTARAHLSNLALDTTYHFRFVATNGSGTAAGPDETFTTFGIETFWIKVIDQNGQPYTQAGGHPYEKILHYRFNHTMVMGSHGEMVPSLDAFLRNVITEQPPGQSGVQEEETKKCPSYLAEENRCGLESQVGELEIEYLEEGFGTTTKPLYNVVAPNGVATRYATLDPYSASDTSVRSASDYGTTSTGRNIGEEAKALGATIRIWGVPSEHLAGTSTSANLRNPTSCQGPQTVTMRAETWKEPGLFATKTTQMPAITGCDKLEFHPSVEWQPTSHVADSPTGLHVDIHQPQSVKPDQLAYADLKDVTIDPGKGLIFNPAGASGLVGCSAAQIGMHREGPAKCPPASKIGTMQIDTPLVDHPLRGGIYMAAPHDNEFDAEFAIYLAVDDPRTGVDVKLAGEIDADHQSAQLGASFSENPQMPVEDFKLDFFGGPRSVLRTPSACGTYLTHATLTPWSAPGSGPPAQASDSFQITSGPDGQPCAGDEGSAPNEPRFRAGSVDPAAGSYSPYVVRLERDDGTQQMGRLSITPPQGLLAKLAGVPRCAPAAVTAAKTRTGTEEQVSPSCPASSRVGSVLVAAGAGGEPYLVEGSTYLSGPYGGSPVSLAVIVPVLAGPFDLGTVVVRTPLLIDLESAAVGVETDPLPTILDGVSLDVRSIEVRLDRPGFTVNPTDCSPSQTTASLISLANQPAQLSDPFQVSGCSRLKFAPKISMRLSKARRRAHPTLKAVLTMPKGNASIARVAVALPPTEFLDSGNIGEICTRPQFLAESCPADSVYGHVAAWSPLLDQPLSGAVYLRSADRGFPQLVADLNGEFRIAVAGRIESAFGGIGTSIKGLPDVPLSKFVLTMRGGPKGLLQNALDVCAHPGRASIRLEGHNGKVARLHPRLRASCDGHR
jgi:DNA-binding beta-propeller fold protein YncE